MNDTTLIADGHELVGATTRHGTPLQVYDDAFGGLYVYRNSLGSVGIVRAQTWWSAWAIVEDEFLTPIEPHEVPEAFGYCVCQDRNKAIPYQFDPAKVTAWCVYHDDDPQKELARFSDYNAAARWALEHASDNDAELVEGYSYQSNVTNTGIVQHDLNGEALDILTPELLEELGITLITEEDQ